MDVVKSESDSHSVMSDSFQPHELYSPCNSPGQNAGVGSLSLLQGIFPTQGSNPGFLHCRHILYQLSYQGKAMDVIVSSIRMIFKDIMLNEISQTQKDKYCYDCTHMLYLK